MCTAWHNEKNTVKQHAPQNILYNVYNYTCLRGHFTIFHCLLHLFIIVEQIISIIAYKVCTCNCRVKTPDTTHNKKEKKPHNHWNKCSLVGWRVCSNKEHGVKKPKFFRCSLVKIGIDFRMQFCCTNGINMYREKDRESIW